MHENFTVHLLCLCSDKFELRLNFHQDWWKRVSWLKRCRTFLYDHFVHTKEGQRQSCRFYLKYICNLSNILNKLSKSKASLEMTSPCTSFLVWLATGVEGNVFRTAAKLFFLSYVYILYGSHLKLLRFVSALR